MSLKTAAIVAGIGCAAALGLWATGIVTVQVPSSGDVSDRSDPPAVAKDEKAEDLKALEALGYISSVPVTQENKSKRGVTLHRPSVPADDLFIVNPTWERSAGGPVREAFLFRMDGTQVHRWRPVVPDEGKKGWGGARLDDQGFLHVVADGALIKYDWEGHEVWRHDARHHHDLNFALDGGPVAVSERLRDVPGLDGVETLTIKDHGATFFSRDGEVVLELWLYDALRDEPRFAEVMSETIAWKRKRFGERVDWTKPADVFHLNSLEVLPRDIEGLGRAGDVLCSPRAFDRIFVIDPKSKEVRWRWGAGELDKQHDPTLTAEGNVVVFDNGRSRKFSRVLVVDPSTGSIVRDHRGTQPFYSSGRGSAQSLADGSLFVVVSNEARLFRVGPDTDATQWEFLSGWMQNGARLPLRAVQLEGAPLQVARGILDGRVPTPTL